jgi:hypothetical protein
MTKRDDDRQEGFEGLTRASLEGRLGEVMSRDPRNHR